MTTDLSFTNTTTTEALGGTSYNITQSASTPVTGSDVTLNYQLPVTIGSDVVRGTIAAPGFEAPSEQTDNFSVMNMHTLDAEDESYVWLNGDVLTNNGTFTASGDSGVIINSEVLGGSGMSFISGPTDNFSGAGLPDTTPTATAAYMDILRGLVGSGQTFALGYAASLIIDNPQTFFGRIDVDTKGPMIIALGDLTATSYSFNGSELVLYNNNTPIDRLALTDPNPDNLVAFNATGGVAIVTKGFLSGESVPLLPMHMGA